jgi:Ni/Fe-hydrogenase subunit HybB-like protein
MARVLAVLLSVYLLARFLDLRHRGALALVLEPRLETWLFWLEILLMLVPLLLLLRRAVRLSPDALYASAVMVIFGFVAHRLNVSITGMEAGSGTSYFPKWTEVMVTLAIIALGFAIFRFAAKYFPVFPEEAPPPLPAPAAGD